MLLQYSFEVINARAVDQALAGIERRLVQHNARVSRTVGAPAARAARSTSGAANEQARFFSQIARVGMTAERRAYNEKMRLEAARHRQVMRNQQREQKNLFSGLAQIGRIAAREEARRLRAAQRAELAAARVAQREFRSRTGAMVGGVSGSIGTVGKAGLAATGIASGAFLASKLGTAASLERQQQQVITNARAAGTEGAFTQKELGASVRDTSIATGASEADLTAGLSAYVARTGDLKTAEENLRVFAQTAMATGATVEDVANTAADLSGKFKINSVEDMSAALATLVFQGKKGAFELRDMAEQFPEMAAAAERAGLTGQGGVRTLGGLAQIARRSTGSGAEASTSVQMMLTQLIADADKLKSGEALGGRKVNIFEGKDATTGLRDTREVIADVVSSSRGNLTQLQDVFDVRGIRAVSPMISEFRRVFEEQGGGEKGEKAGREAILAMIEDASDAGGTFADVQRDAEDALSTASVQLEILNTKLSAAIQTELLPALVALVPHITEVVPHFAKLVTIIAEVIDRFAKDPLGNIGHIMAAKVTADIAAAALGTTIRDTLVGAITGNGKGGPGTKPTPGLLGDAGALGTALAAVTIATLSVETFNAGTLAIDSFMTGNKDETNAMIRRGNARTPEEVDAAIAEAQKEFAETDVPGSGKGKALLMDAIADAMFGGGKGFFDLREKLGITTEDINRSTSDTAKSETEHRAKLIEQIEALKKQQAEMFSKVLKVEVTNQPGEVPNRGNSPSPVKT